MTSRRAGDGAADGLGQRLVHQAARYSGARPAIRPTRPFARLQFQEVRGPQPEIWSPMALPTRPVKKPTIGPKAIAEERDEGERRPDRDVLRARDEAPG